MVNFLTGKPRHVHVESAVSEPFHQRPAHGAMYSHVLIRIWEIQGLAKWAVFNQLASLIWENWGKSMICRDTGVPRFICFVCWVLLWTWEYHIPPNFAKLLNFLILKKEKRGQEVDKKNEFLCDSCEFSATIFCFLTCGFVN